MTAPQFRAASAGTTAAGSVVINKPAGVVETDVMLACIVSTAGSNIPVITPPSGWTAGAADHRHATGTDVCTASFSKKAGASEPSTYTFTNSIAFATSGVISAYINAGLPANVTGVGTGDSTTLITPSITTTVNDCTVVLMYGHQQSANITADASTTERSETASGPRVMVADFAQTTAGATGTKSATILSTGRWGALAIALPVGNIAPNAPTLNSPATGTTVDRAVTQRFAWTSSDPDAGDSQSKFDLRYKIVGAGSWTTTVSQTTPNSFWDAVGGTFALGDYEWQARTYDALGKDGPWSPSSFFTAADAPAGATITAPINGATISTATATLAWSAPTQTHYQYRRMDDVAGAAGTTVYYDSGEITDAVTRSLTVAYPVNNRTEHTQVRIKKDGLWSEWADNRNPVSWTPPMAPTIVATTDPSTATIRVAITNPTPTGGAPVTSYNDVYVSSPLDPEDRLATLVPPNSTWVWRMPSAVRPYTIRAVAVGANGTVMSQVADTVVIDGGGATTTFETILDGGTP